MSRNTQLLNLFLRFRPKSVAGWVVLGTLAVVYLMVAPTLGRRLGVDLPGFGGGGEHAERIGPAVAADGGDADGRDVLTVAGVVDATQEGGAATSERPGKDTRPAGDGGDAGSKKGDASPQLGVLKKTGDMVFETTAGLVYTRGSADGHRLKHVMRHAEDVPGKPVHGVFDPGGERAVFAAIDEAYLIADLRGPPQARKQTEDGRTIWTVDMKRRVGYLGGQSGKRKGNPPLTGIKLVLEGRNVITAFPVEIRGRR